MENMDYDLRSIQEVRNLARLGQVAQDDFLIIQTIRSTGSSEIWSA